MKAVIMAAGKSTRTYPLTLTRPKPLLPIMNKPIVERQLDALKPLVDGVVLIVGYKHEMLRAHLGDQYQGLPITYVEQTEQLGTGHAILQCAPYINEPFIAMNGDDLFDPQDLARLAGVEQAALVKYVDDPRLFGIYEVTDGNRVVRLVEKPVEIFSNLANIGAYRFTPDVFEVLATTEKSERGEIEITSAIQTLADRGDFRVVESDGYWLPIGYPWHLLDATQYWMDNYFEAGAHGEVSPMAVLDGPVYVGRGTVIKPGVVIEGPVHIGEHCTIGPNCWLRPYTVLGDGCRVGQASEIKASIFFEHAFAPHQNYIGDSVIGAHVNLGCGTVTANLRHDGEELKSIVNRRAVKTGRRKLGTIIGDNVHTGIMTGIYPGRKIWPGLSTLPGQMVDRDLMD